MSDISAEEVARQLPMPKGLREFPEGALIRHISNGFYRLLTSAVWDGTRFISGRCTCLKDGGQTGDYDVTTHSDRWVVGYLEATGQAERREAQAACSRCLLGKPCTCDSPDVSNRVNLDEATIAKLQRAEDEMSGRRARLIAALVSEKRDDSRPLVEQRVHEGRNCRVYQPRVLGGKP
jgi:hypothetical protein